MKTYRGSAAAARSYVQAGRSRADDYYLAEGTGIAQRYTASADGSVRELAALSGDGYEAWVVGADPQTGAAKGRLRHDPNAVRFVEIVVNGPKSWSLAAELHPDISAAYDTAQDAAAREILGWLGAHSTTRVGSRGAQIQVPVEAIEAAVVRHYTSRAGDPHRHLHLQVNARVLSGGRWRALHTVGVRDSLDAINGIGHAAVLCDPGFRGALATHGFTLDPGTGEVRELAAFVGRFSARAAQIGRNLDRYETQWRAANPGREPGPALRRAWDSRAWAEARPDKITPREGAELTARWVGELRDLGYHDPTRPVALETAGIGALDREHAVAEVLDRLAARRSGWNAADIRGEVEQHLARAGIITTSAVRGELAEDLTARTVAMCVPLLDRGQVPGHVRNLTSAHVLAVEAELAARLAQRAETPAPTAEPTPVRAAADVAPDASSAVDRVAAEADASAAVGLDAAQREEVRVLAGDARLVLIEGAAGAGKTSTLAATQTALAQSGHRMVVLTPTLNAAQVAARELGTRAFSTAWLAHQHGYRWSDHGTWTRLAVGEVDPVTGSVFTGPGPQAVLRAGDLLLVDEAGMLDQDTARALLSIADEHHVRLALVGDRHQLPAIGRGGVLDLAARWTSPEAHRTLDAVHRFVREIAGPDGASRTVPDGDYADLSLAMRSGEDPGVVFDRLLARGQIRVHSREPERLAALTETGTSGAGPDRETVLIADTREQVAALNALTRDRLVATGTVDHTRAIVTDAGQRIGSGDRVTTRRNDTHLDVANRDTWTVTGVDCDGGLTVAGERGVRLLPVSYVREHVELGYASTVYGAQGATVHTAHVLLGEHSTAASAYVAMTRGRHANIAHLVADNTTAAREQWIATFAKDRADLGPTGARHAAQHALARYGTQPTTTPGPADGQQLAAATIRPADAQQLTAALDRLRDAWTEQAIAQHQSQRAQHELDTTTAKADWWAHCGPILTPLRQQLETAHDAKENAEKAAAGSDRTLSEATGRHAVALRRSWDLQLADADTAARTVAAGAGRLGLHRGRVHDAQTHLDTWTAHWAPAFTGSTVDLEATRANPGAYYSWVVPIADALRAHAGRLAAADHPELIARLRARDDAGEQYRAASDTYHQIHEELAAQSALPVYDTGAAEKLPALHRDVATARERAEQADRAVRTLIVDPAITSQPDPTAVLERARREWEQDRSREAAERKRQHLTRQRAAYRRIEPHAHTIGNNAPSIGI